MKIGLNFNKTTRCSDLQSNGEKILLSTLLHLVAEKKSTPSDSIIRATGSRQRQLFRGPAQQNGTHGVMEKDYTS